MDGCGTALRCCPPAHGSAPTPGVCWGAARAPDCGNRLLRGGDSSCQNSCVDCSKFRAGRAGPRPGVPPAPLRYRRAAGKMHSRRSAAPAPSEQVAQLSIGTEQRAHRQDDDLQRRRPGWLMHRQALDKARHMLGDQHHDRVLGEAEQPPCSPGSRGTRRWSVRWPAAWCQRQRPGNREQVIDALAHRQQQVEQPQSVRARGRRFCRSSAVSVPRCVKLRAASSRLTAAGRPRDRHSRAAK